MSLRKVALVTGGSAGLGASIARVLARDLGLSVIVNYSQNAERAEALVRELRQQTADASSGSQADRTWSADPVFQAIKADLSQKADMARLVEAAAAAGGGRLDVVVSNVGWTQMRNFYDLDDGMHDADWAKCFTTNVQSHLWLFHAARPWLEQSNARDPGAAVFVSTASVAGCKPSGSSLPYAVSKAAQIHLIKSLAVIAAPSIRVNCVSPGLLLTDWGLTFPKEKLETVKEVNKLRRFATVEDVAEQVKTFVVSKSATGQNAVVDAGFSL